MGWENMFREGLLLEAIGNDLAESETLLQEIKAMCRAVDKSPTTHPDFMALVQQFQPALKELTMTFKTMQRELKPTSPTIPTDFNADVHAAVQKKMLVGRKAAIEAARLIREKRRNRP